MMMAMTSPVLEADQASGQDWMRHHWKGMALTWWMYVHRITAWPGLVTYTLAWLALNLYSAALAWRAWNQLSRKERNEGVGPLQRRENPAWSNPRIWS